MTETAKIITYYSGEIFQYFEGNDCLLMRAWRINESLPASEPFAKTVYSVLYDSPKKDPVLEIKKVIPNIPSDIFPDF
jgi:hypothetical protein